MYQCKSTILFVIACCLCAVGNVTAGEWVQRWQLEQFDAPESVLYDEQRDKVYVANVQGVPNDKDSKGYISLLNLSGEVETQYWITGLHAPKGMARVGSLLYVADIDVLVVIDIDTATIQRRYPAADAQFLNDVVAAADGTVYVSDMVTNAIYRLSDSEFSLWLQSDALEGPNGLLTEGEQLIIASWGIMTNGFSTDVPGQVKILNIHNKTIQNLGAGQALGNLDGIKPDGQGNYYVTDWMNPGLYVIDSRGHATPSLSLPKGAADFEWLPKQGILLVPEMLKDRVTAYQLQ